MNALRDLYAASKPAIGTFFSAGSPSMLEALRGSGLDFVIIDCEHGAFDTMDMVDLIRAAELADIVPAVRIASVSHQEVQRAADSGAQVLIVPCLRGVDEFKKLVDLATYPPLGSRGFIKGRGSQFGRAPWAQADSLEGYFARATERLMVMPQCETAEALDSIEEIVALDGIDGIFIGPFDLSIALGVPGRFDAPVMQEATSRILAACREVNKPCYILSMDVHGATSLLSSGYAGVAHNLDFNVLRDAYEAITSGIRNGLA